MTVIGVKEFKSSDDITDWLNRELEHYKIKIISIETVVQGNPESPKKIAIRVWYQVE